MKMTEVEIKLLKVYAKIAKYMINFRKNRINCAFRCGEINH